MNRAVRATAQDEGRVRRVTSLVTPRTVSTEAAADFYGFLVNYVVAGAIKLWFETLLLLATGLRAKSKLPEGALKIFPHLA